MLGHTLVSAALAASAFASLQAPVKHTPFSDLYRRQVTSVTYSEDAYILRIIDSITESCSPVCQPFLERTELCITRGTSDRDLATCTCDGPSLARMQTCASCIADDPASSNSGASLQDYNGFASLCVGVDLARPTAVVDIAGSSQAPSSASPATTAQAEDSAVPTAPPVTLNSGTAAEQGVTATEGLAAATTLATSGAGVLGAGGVGAAAIIAVLALL